jgi:hypothetical protein
VKSPTNTHQNRELSCVNPVNRALGRFTIHLATLLVTMATAAVSHAEIITIDPSSGVTASSEIGATFDRKAAYIVDGSGLSGGQHTNAPPDGQIFWLSAGTCCGGVEDLDPSVTFDLGAAYTIHSFHVWNYNEVNLPNRGVNDVSVQYGTTAALGSTVAQITNFAIASGQPTDLGEEFDEFTPFSARFIKFDINSNHGDPNIFYGLSEVQFDGALSGVLVSPDIIPTSASLGARVGTLTTPSGDAGDTFSYVLISGEGDSDNGKFQIVGDDLQAGAYDFSTAADGTEFSVRVRSTGSPSGEQIEAALTISAVADSDADDLLDSWEEKWAGAGNLAVLSGLGDADADGDSLTDLAEFNLRDQIPNLDPTQPPFSPSPIPSTAPSSAHAKSKCLAINVHSSTLMKLLPLSRFHRCLSLGAPGRGAARNLLLAGGP